MAAKKEPEAKPDPSSETEADPVPDPVEPKPPRTVKEIASLSESTGQALLEALTKNNDKSILDNLVPETETKPDPEAKQKAVVAEVELEKPVKRDLFTPFWMP